MSLLYTQVGNELVLQIIRLATGALFTKEQIQNISSHSVGRYLTDLFPEDEEKKNRKERIQDAQRHIENASNIIGDLKSELDAQTSTLDRLILEIEEKKSIAQRYANLAAANEESVAAMRTEMEDALRKELVRQSEEGRVARRIASALLWTTTIVAGAALGAYFKDIVAEALKWA